MKNTLYLSLGSNIGQRQQILQKAVELIEQRIGKVKKTSSIYETEPWNFISEHNFLNLALRVETELDAITILHITQQIESDLGRAEKSNVNGYSDRSIDIDIILFNQEIIETPELTIPHPLMHKRSFVLMPLCQIAPNTKHPILHKSIHKLKEELENDK